jgi:uncharacterized RDD family membrane protein YckC
MYEEVGFLDPRGEASSHVPVSDDPKSPLDAPPQSTPDLLQKDLSLDRRNRRIPTFEELRGADAPTDPDRLRVARAPAAPARPPPQSTMPATPRLLERPPLTQPGALPAQAPRAQPPSPTEWASQPRPPAQPQPQAPRQASVAPMITAAPAEQAAGTQNRNAVPRHQTAHQAQRPPLTAPPGLAPRSQPTPTPIAARPPAQPQPAPVRQPVVDAGYRAIAEPLPASMLVTQPGMSSPFKNNPGLLETLDLPEAPAPAPERTRLLEPAPETPAAAASRAPRQLGRPAAKKPDDRILASPAGLLRRVLAWLVDLSVIGAVAGLFLLGAAMIIAPKGAQVLKSLLSIAVPALLLAAILAFVYTTLFAFLFRGRTPGRRLLGIHLVDGTGAAPGPGRALLRAALSLVSFALFLSGFWLALFDRHGQTLHDKLTRTFVVRLQA